MRGLEPIGAAQPHLIVAAGGRVGDGQFALVDGVVGHLLCVVDAAEKLVSDCVVWLSGEEFVEAGGGFIDAALLEEGIGLGRVGQEKTNSEEEKQSKGKTNTDWMCRDEHG